MIRSLEIFDEQVAQASVFAFGAAVDAANAELGAPLDVTKLL